MYRIINVLTLVILSAIAGAQQPDPMITDKIAAGDQKNYASRQAFAESMQYSLYDLVYQRMNWNIDPAVKYIKGVVTSYVVNRNEILIDVEFDLISSLQVDSVLQNSNPVEFVHENNKLVITLNNELAPGEMDSVAVYYQGVPDPENTGAFTTGQHQAVPVMWTLSEPYGAMEWWPCKQTLTDKIDSIDVVVTSPEPYRTASHGLLISESVSEGLRTMHWRHRYPIVTYLVAIAVTNYQDYSHDVNVGEEQMKVRNFVYPEYSDVAQQNTPVTVDLIELFNQLIGDYPFAKEKYGHAQFGWGGGMEHQTISFMVNFNFDLVAHELAHQWFGDYITLASWHDIWLNEGFATYMTGLAYEHLLEGVWWPVWKKQTVSRITLVPGGSVYVQDTTNISRIFSSRLSYSKGAYLLHMLRWVMGDEAFFNGLRNYYNDPEIANGFARHEDFVTHMEAAGDTSLTEFFNDWYYGEGFPVYSLYYSDAGEGRYNLRLMQTPSHESVSFFEMPVPVRLYSADRTDSLDVKLVHSENNQEFTIEPGFVVDEVLVDPDYWLISSVAEVVNVPLLEWNQNLLLYPNPVRDELNIYLPGNGNIQSIELFDLHGKSLIQLEGHRNVVPLNSVPKGVYLVKVKTDGKQFTRRIVRE